jgi:hypothetical protein
MLTWYLGDWNHPPETRASLACRDLVYSRIQSYGLGGGLAPRFDRGNVPSAARRVVRGRGRGRERFRGFAV